MVFIGNSSVVSYCSVRKKILYADWYDDVCLIINLQQKRYKAIMTSLHNTLVKALNAYIEREEKLLNEFEAKIADMLAD